MRSHDAGPPYYSQPQLLGMTNIPMQVDPQSEDSSLQSHGPGDVTLDFNQEILRAIEVHRDNDTAFRYLELLHGRDFHILLHIALQTFHQECWMTQSDCEAYLRVEQDLSLSLHRSYTSQDYTSLKDDSTWSANFI